MVHVLVLSYIGALLSGSLSAAEPVQAAHGMVVAEEAAAADVGLDVLKSGGNAVDAAVAVGFALAVTHPYAGNIGGGGFMLVRFADGRTTFIDFRERAPAAASRDMYLDAEGNATRDSIDGWRSVGVPGSVRGFELAQKKYGRKTWLEVLTPSVNLAQSGFRISPRAARTMKSASNMKRDPESRRIFQNRGRYYAGEARLRQPELAATLKRISTDGARDFYEGFTAKRLAAEMAKHHGLITLDDLKNYQAVERVPLTGHYRDGRYQDYDVITAPPPSSGGIGLLQMLGMLEGSGYETSGPGSAASVHYVAEVMRRFFADRSQYLGDPDFINNPMARLLDPAYIRSRRENIQLDRASSSDEIQPGLPATNESTETTHYSIVDAEGNAVAVTYTLNNSYGSGITVPGLGFLLNDEMDDFASKPGSPNMFGLVQGETNAIGPGKRPLSAMSPTIVVRDGKPFLVLGAPGGPRIITSVLQVILNVIDFHLNIQDAVDAPRFHHQWKPDQLTMEKDFAPETYERLQAMGHKLDSSPGLVIARVEAILVNGGQLFGAADSRWVGKAVGY